jgi:hypothetical protein
VQPARVAQPSPLASPPPCPPIAAHPADEPVQGGFCLFLPLKDPAQMPALLCTIQRHQQTIHDALAGLRSVHFARFVPSLDGSTLLVITVYDGELKPYVMDFASKLKDQFTAILEFVRDAPRLPVEKYPDDFWRFVDSHNVGVPIFSAYPKTTVLDITEGMAP